jgi:outer membrane protein assembly factor BamB
VRESDGSLAWSASVENGDDSSPAVSSSGVYVSYACAQTYDFNPIGGALNWHYSTSCEGGGGRTPVLAGGRLYVRDWACCSAILDASTGALVGPFGTQTLPSPAPAVDSSEVYYLQNGTLTASSISTGQAAWTFTGDGTLASAPIIAGGTVIVGGTSGELYGLSAATGAVQWSTNVGGPIQAASEQNLSAPDPGLSTSGGLLLVPTGSELVALR